MNQKIVDDKVSSDGSGSSDSTVVKSSPGGSFYSRSERNSCPLEGVEVSYNDLALLKKFTSAYGRIIPRRITGVSLKKQRDLAAAVKKARILALLPYCDVHA